MFGANAFGWAYPGEGYAGSSPNATVFVATVAAVGSVPAVLAGYGLYVAGTVGPAFPPGRLAPIAMPTRGKLIGSQMPDIGNTVSRIPIYPPGMIAPQSLLRSRLDQARSRDNRPHTTYYIAPWGSNTNGGTSMTVRSTGIDAHTNSNSGLDRTTSISADGTWSSADVGHVIKVGNNYRLITAFVPPKTLGSVTTTSGTNTCSSAGLFSPSMIGQRFVGPGVPSSSDRTVATFVDASNITLSGTTPTGSSGSATLSSMFLTSGPTLFGSNTGGQTWTVGGPWKTFLGTVCASASPLSGGDTVYLAPGVYRDQNITDQSPMRDAPINVIGDVTGSHTGVQGGEVRFAARSYEMEVTGWAFYTSTQRRFGFAFSNIVFEHSGTNTGTACLFNLGSLTDTSFTDCVLIESGSANILSFSSLAPDIPLNLTIDRCTFFTMTTLAMVQFSFPAANTKDFNMNILIQNCQFVGAAQSLRFNGTAGTFRGGGAVVRNCSFTNFATTSIVVDDVTPLPGNYPVYVYECAFNSTTVNPMTSGAAGQLIEDYNVFNGNTTLSNVVLGGHSIGFSSTGVYRALNVSIGQERIWGGIPKYAFSPVYDEDITLGTGGMPDGINPIPIPSSVDIGGRPRTSTGRFVASGTVTSATTADFTDTSAPFTANLTAALVSITGGTGAGQTRVISTNTSSVISIYNVWATTPDATSTYSIYWGTPLEGGQATGSSSTTLSFTSASTWNIVEFVGFTVEITAGTGIGQTRRITATTSNNMTITPVWTVNPDATSRYIIYRGVSATTQNRSAGAWERHDLADKETATTDAGSVAIRLAGQNQHRFRIPVNAGVTNISVKARFDSNHGSTSRPQACIVANPEVGVVAQVVTMQAAADTWETLAFTAFTPTSAGWIEVELQSHAAVPYGRAYFDTFSVA